MKPRNEKYHTINSLTTVYASPAAKKEDVSSSLAGVQLNEKQEQIILLQIQQTCVFVPSLFVSPPPLIARSPSLYILRHPQSKTVKLCPISCLLYMYTSCCTSLTTNY